jgi:hypothetical protein
MKDLKIISEVELKIRKEFDEKLENHQNYFGENFKELNQKIKELKQMKNDFLRIVEDKF